MLVCSVSLQRHDVIVAATVVEAAAALDDPATVIVVGTLVDSPGDARDNVDGFVGQQVKETATATATVSVAMAYKIAVLEDTTAVSAVNGLLIPKHVVTATMLEAAAATATQDATSSGAGLVPRSGMIGTVYVNSDGTVRQANADGGMVNL